DHGRGVVLEHPFVYAWVAARSAVRMLTPDHIILSSLTDGYGGAAVRALRGVGGNQPAVLLALCAAGAARVRGRAPVPAPGCAPPSSRRRACISSSSAGPRCIRASVCPSCRSSASSPARDSRLRRWSAPRERTRHLDRRRGGEHGGNAGGVARGRAAAGCAASLRGSARRGGGRYGGPRDCGGGPPERGRGGGPPRPAGGRGGSGRAARAWRGGAHPARP